MASKFSCENEQDFLQDWFTSTKNYLNAYKEPLLDEDCSLIIMESCTFLALAPAVFILAIEVLEDYLRLKCDRKEKIKDPNLTMATVIFICAKSDGCGDSITLNNIAALLLKLTNRLYDTRKICKMEIEILKTISGKIPLITKLDDTNLILAHYSRLGYNVEKLDSLCLHIINFLYLKRQLWFQDLKKIYHFSRETVEIFKCLMESKLYFPVCVFLAALQITDCLKERDLEMITVDITEHCNIHKDHLLEFVNMITNLINLTN